MSRTSKREFKDAAYAATARVGQALANGHRLELLDLLDQSERGVEELAELSGMTVANTSQHLQVLRASHLVRMRRDGVRSLYRLADGSSAVWRALRRFGQASVPEVDRVMADYFARRDALDEVGTEELAAGLRDGTMVLIDVRPSDEYERNHIPGARSTPIERLARDVEQLPRDVEIIAYCRGPFCVFSDEAVRLLRQRGYHARRFPSSAADWHHDVGRLPPSPR